MAHECRFNIRLLDEHIATGMLLLLLMMMMLMLMIFAMASLVWVTPGAATEGVTPLFFS